MVFLTNNEAFISSSRTIATFARDVSANVPAVNVDDVKLDDNKEVEEKDGDKNHESDGRIDNKRKLKFQQVVSISSRVNVINWVISGADQNGEQGLVLREIDKFPLEFHGNYKICRESSLKQ